MTSQEKMVEIIQMSNAALVKAAKLEEEKAALQQKIAAAIPAVVKALVDGDRIDSNLSDAVSRTLQDPVQTLHLLAKVAKHRNAEEVTRVGHQVAKTASDGSQTKRAAEESQSYKQLFERILGNRV